MSLTYAIPDLHGRLDLLDAALDRITEHAGGESATIVTLGDYVDRGPSSREVLERLMNFRSGTLRMIVLKGNHEAMMWEACNDPTKLDWWIRNGGDATLASYQLDAGSDGCVPPAHLAWIACLPLM